MTDPKAQDWKERFEKKFIRLIPVGDGGPDMWEFKNIHFITIIDFIAQEIAAAEERGRQEIWAKLSGPIPPPGWENDLKNIFIEESFDNGKQAGHREVIEELERQVEDGGSAKVILAAVKRNFTP